MKNIMIKIGLILLLFISMFDTGAVSGFLQDINSFLLGNTFFWVIIVAILFIMNSFLKSDSKKYFEKYLIAITLVGISVDIMYTLIKIKLKFDLNYEFFVDQTVFRKENIEDGIGFIQSFFEVAINTLFGTLGIYIIAFLLFIIGIFLILDIDKFFAYVGKLVKDIFTSEEEEYEEEEIDKTIDLSEYNKKQEKVEASTVKKKKKQTPSKKSLDFERKTTRKTPKKESGNIEFEPPRNLGNKNIESKSELNKKKIKTKVETPLESQLFPSSKEEKPKESKVQSKELPKQIKEVEAIKLKGNKSYKIPPVSLLLNIEDNKENYNKLKLEAKSKSKLLLSTLESFKVKAQLRNIIVGSSITRYELQPELGQKVNKFSTLNNDLAMALSAKSIRIEAPIPGKPLVGIEVPNEKRLMVGLKEVIKANIYDSKGKLKIALGKDIEGMTKTLDIAKAPHLLVAGATGSGKSVCINGIIVNILLKSTPEEVKFLLIDPKKVELTPYDGIPHLLSPVITDPEKAAVALNKLVYEMEKRYDMFAETRTRNIETYNKTQTEEKLPYIVAIIDELADLMMVSSTEVEVAISRLAQKARAAGIHLILATQRPSTDVITGLIKSNIPTRISFSVSSSIDSRTILDKSGAEKLLGNGDMLLSTNESPNPIRIQGAYLSDEEIQDVVEYINKQFAKEDIDKYYEDDFLKLEVIKQEDTGENEDSLLLEAISLGIEHNKISTSMLQRRLRIGFNRATTIIEQLEQKGWISKSLGNNKGREILVTKYEVFGDE